MAPLSRWQEKARPRRTAHADPSAYAIMKFIADAAWFVNTVLFAWTLIFSGMCSMFAWSFRVGDAPGAAPLPPVGGVYVEDSRGRPHS
jgi:hypothetical protein